MSVRIQQEPERALRPCSGLGDQACPELPDLPIRPFLPAISEALSSRGALVLKADPGAGKTSLVPLHLAVSGTVEGRILVLEPRRMAAVAAANRAAELWGCPVGSRAGYRIRGETKVSENTVLEFMTHGVFIRIIQSDPSLASVGLIVFDEFHERSWQNDLAFALCRDISSLRDDLKMLVMSATLDTGACESALACSSITVPGLVHPVETRYHPRPKDADVAEYAAREAEALAGECGGDVLVFLPGMAQIQAADARISARNTGIDVRRLHSSIPLREQLDVLKPRQGSRPRIILSTSIAETSLTVPGVRGVVDTGLVRINRFHARSGLNRLVTESEAVDRADQRRGRAGRTAPGICVRLWPERSALVERTVPEIFHSDLSSAFLEAALWGTTAREGLSWMDAPPESAWDAARDLLVLLGAVEASGAIHSRGKRMAGLGMEPRLAAIVLAGLGGAEEDPLLADAACFLASLFGYQGATSRTDCDIESRIRGLDARSLSSVLEEADRLAAATRFAHGDQGRRMGKIGRMARSGSGKAEARELSLSSATGGSPGASGTIHGTINDAITGTTTGSVTRAMPEAILGGDFDPAPLLAVGFPDRLARRESGDGARSVFRLATGRLISVSGALARSAWIVAVEADAGTGAQPGVLYSGASLKQADAEAILAPWTKTSLELEWSAVTYSARARRRSLAFLLSERPAGRVDHRIVEASFAAHLAARGISILPWDQRSTGLLGRIRAFWRYGVRNHGEAPDDEYLAAHAETWLLPWLRIEDNPVLDPTGLCSALESLVPEDCRRTFATEAPESLALPAGIRRKLVYRPDGSVLLEAKVHEFYGIRTQPTVLGRPVVASLLSPAGRSVHMTTDLPGFWTQTWKEVRKDLRGRYPRHDWPENPAIVEPRSRSLKPRN